jgi:hypothetical protein
MTNTAERQPLRDTSETPGLPMSVLRQITTYAAVLGMLAAMSPITGPASAAEPDPNHRNHKGQGNKPAAATQQRGGGSTPAPRPAPAPPQVRINPAPVARAPSPQQVYRPAPTPPPRYEARGRDYNDGRRRDRNRYIGAGVAAVIIGSTLGYRYYRGPSRDSIYDRCDNNFPDFEYDTGTFINEDGDRELCPYLRPYVD